MSPLRSPDRVLALVAVGTAACGHAASVPVENSTATPSPHDELARVSCGDASVTWLGDAAADPQDPVGGLREVLVQVGARSITWRHYDGTTIADWPEATFAPDCRHAAIL